MSSKVAADKAVDRAKKDLGNLIFRCRRDTLNQSQLAQRVGLPRSNMKYIEDGVNAPTAEVYEKLIRELRPDGKTQRRMDRLYMEIRKVPPPDVCRTIAEHMDLIDVIRKLEGCRLTPDRIERISALFVSFQEKEEGDSRDDG